MTYCINHSRCEYYLAAILPKNLIKIIASKKYKHYIRCIHKKRQITNGPNYQNVNTKEFYVIANEYTKGDYTCTVDNGNGCGKTTAPATLSIEFSPLTVTTPSSQTVCDGGFMGWDITVSGGSDKYTYQWYKDDLVLSNDPDRSLDNSGRTVYIVPVKKSDTGRYHCEVNDAENPGCPVRTGYFTLTVTDACP